MTDLNNNRDPSYATAIALGLQTAINTALKFDPGTRASLKKLHGKVLAIKSEHGTIFLQAVEEELHVLAHFEGEASATIKGQWLTLCLLIFNPSHSLADSGVTVSGHINVLADYQALMKNLDIDWEDALAHTMGDLPAHYVAQVARGCYGWLKPRSLRTPQFLAEFLTEELQAVPPSAELEHFSQNVNALRQQTDRLNARVEKLLARLAPTQSPQPQ